MDSLRDNEMAQAVVKKYHKTEPCQQPTCLVGNQWR